MLGFHTTLSGQHPYESPPWSWPLLKRPVAYNFAADGSTYRAVIALGNPLAWWPAVVATVAVTVIWIRRGLDVLQPELVIVAAAIATYGPWLVLSGSRSQVFLWYLLPTLPFLYLAVGLLVAWGWQWLGGRIAALAYAAVLAASFAFYLPLLVALPVDADGWWLRIPFRDCARPGAATLPLPDDTINRGPPPDGWCWI
jgi:dolichyl-phosphate-mannose--protein O-mannosyl transferase